MPRVSFGSINDILLNEPKTLEWLLHSDVFAQGLGTKFTLAQDMCSWHILENGTPLDTYDFVLNVSYFD